MPKVTRKEVYNIKPFRHITVGDPWYMENEQFSKRKDLVFDENLRCCNVGAMVIEEVHDKDPQFNWDLDSVLINIVLAKDERQLDIYLQGREYKNTRKIEIELGCDTAQFIMEVTDKKGNVKYEEFDTGGDGGFGFAVKYKEGYGMRVTLDLDADMFSFEEVVNRMSYLFEFDKDKDLVMFEENNEEMELE